MNTNYTDLIGKTFSSVLSGDDNLVFTTADGEAYEFYHNQGCCESVYIAEIIGDLHDLEGSPVLEAEESYEDHSVGYDSATWTFYRFATLKGYVTVRWVGESNGYYSESVDFRKRT